MESVADFPYTLTVLSGSSAKKKEQISNAAGEGLQILVINYESAWRLEKELAALDKLKGPALAQQRYQMFRAMGQGLPPAGKEEP